MSKDPFFESEHGGQRDHRAHLHGQSEMYNEVHRLRGAHHLHGHGYGHHAPHHLHDHGAHKHLPHLSLEDHSGHRRAHLGDATPSANGFGLRLLEGLGAPVTAANLKFLDAWQRAEGGSPDNPFNTSQRERGARTFNSDGVKRYGSMEVGLHATIATLRNGLYGGVLHALYRGDSPHAAALALRNSPWGSHNITNFV